MASLPNDIILEIYSNLSFEQVIRDTTTFPILKKLHKIMYDKNRHTWNWAALYGHLDVIKWLNSKRIEGCTTVAMDRAARFGHIDILKFLYENRKEGCTSAAWDWAKFNRNYEVLEFLYSRYSQLTRNSCVLKHL